jgi:hypothetical protein
LSSGYSIASVIKSVGEFVSNSNEEVSHLESEVEFDPHQTGFLFCLPVFGKFPASTRKET